MPVGSGLWACYGSVPTIKRAASPALHLEMPAVPQPMIAATGLYTPPHTITNEELVGTFNTYVQRFNADNAAAIADGSVALLPSSAEFIEKASGIESRSRDGQGRHS